MALTMGQLRSLVEGEGLKYFLDPNRDALMMGARGAHGTYQLVLLLEVEGKFVQLRSISYHACPAGHEHLDATLRLLGELNYSLRFLKFGWDPSDGEVTVYGDTWIEDGGLTQKQFGRIIHAYLTMLDLNYPRIDKTIRTGEDPGEINSGGGPGGSPGLPPALQDLLDRLLKGLGEGKDDDDKPDGVELDKI